MAEEHEVDVAIVGGGPAGTATALALTQRGIATVVLEGSHYDDVRIGETVPPAIKHPLVDLSLWDPFLATEPNPSYANQSVWGTAEIQQQDFIFSPYGSGWHLDRRQFDRMLADTARQRGVRVMTGAKVLAVQPHEQGWLIAGQQSGHPFSVPARFLVDATGRRSTIARKAGRLQHSVDNLIGVVAFLEPESDEAAATNTLLVEAVENGWWYSAPLADGKLVAAYMTDADFLQAEAEKAAFWSDCLRRSNHTQERLRSYQPPSRLTIKPAHTAFMERPAGVNFLAVGDAALAFDPLSAQGIYKALRGATRAATVIAACRDGRNDEAEKYCVELQSEFLRYLERRAAYYGMEGRWPDSRFWQRRRLVASPQPEVTPQIRRDV